MRKDVADNKKKRWSKKRDKNALVKFDDHRRKPRISWFKEAEEIQDPEKAAEIIKRCENIIKKKRKEF